jgi:SHS2 domain-containing protein
MEKYEIVDDITSDVMIRAYGKNLEELIENSAEGLFSIVCDVKNVEKKEVLMVEVEGDDEKELLYNWLSELLTVIDTENMFFSRFEVLELDTEDKFKVRVECHGEEIREELVLTVAKAITYYKYSVDKVDEGWVASFVVDI